MPQIVTINESVIRGAMPNLLQQKACLVSLGATSLSAGNVAEISSLADLSALLASRNNAGVQGAGTPPTAEGSTAQDGAPQASGSDGSSASNNAAMAELTAMARSWFANSTAGCWVLELGAVGVSSLQSAFSAFVEAHPLAFYAYVLPRGANRDTSLAGFMANHASNDGRVYFFLCGDKDGGASLLSHGQGQKSVFYGAEAPGASLTQEHLAAAVAAQFCSARPSALNRLAPMSFRLLTGITPWPEAGNDAVFVDLKRNNIGFAGTANEGGIEGAILFWGTLMNGDPLSGWYGADWCAITLERQLANVIIEGSQPGIRPLIYSQEGINRLAARAQQSLDSATANGCIVPQYTLEATDFNTYISANPSDYTTGTYNGLAATIVPVRGFTSLTFNLAIDFSGQTVSSTTTNAGA